jgi:hypothetical protein
MLICRLLLGRSKIFYIKIGKPIIEADGIIMSTRMVMILWKDLVVDSTCLLRTNSSILPK